ncbi:MAG: hypothetical protein R3D85_05260 [Paracoccaceae bacterium]
MARRSGASVSRAQRGREPSAAWADDRRPRPRPGATDPQRGRDGGEGRRGQGGAGGALDPVETGEMGAAGGVDVAQGRGLGRKAAIDHQVGARADQVDQAGAKACPASSAATEGVGGTGGDGEGRGGAGQMRATIAGGTARADQRPEDGQHRQLRGRPAPMGGIRRGGMPSGASVSAISRLSARAPRRRTHRGQGGGEVGHQPHAQGGQGAQRGIVGRKPLAIAGGGAAQRQETHHGRGAEDIEAGAEAGQSGSGGGDEPARQAPAAPRATSTTKDGTPSHDERAA